MRYSRAGFGGFFDAELSLDLLGQGMVHNLLGNCKGYDWSTISFTIKRYWCDW